MSKPFPIAILLAAGLLTTGSLQAAIMSVAYGTITGISQQERDTSGGARGGALLGGIAGLATGSGRSTSNKALRTLAGGAIGSAAGRTMARGTETVFTVNLVAGGSVRVVMDGDFRIGDCVSVEQGGAAANMRRVASSFCTDNRAVPEVHKAEHRREADECAQAMQRLLEAETEEQVRSAEMVMNILCQD